MVCSNGWGSVSHCAATAPIPVNPRLFGGFRKKLSGYEGPQAPPTRTTPRSGFVDFDRVDRDRCFGRVVAAFAGAGGRCCDFVECVQTVGHLAEDGVARR